MPSKKPIPAQKLQNARMQPIRATQPFQLLQGSPARLSPSASSPTPRSATDARVPVRNWRPSDHRSSPDRNERKSPNSSVVKVPNRRSPSPSVKKNTTFDPITGPYLTGQWPRDLPTPTHQHAMRDKTTQTPDWSLENSNKTLHMKSSSKSNRPSTIADPDFKQMRKQLRTIAKRSSDKKARSPPVHGNHLALHQLPASHPRSNPITIGNQPFGRVSRRLSGNEAAEKEIESISNSSVAAEPRLLQGNTPPDGRRAPPPRCSTRTMETQTPQEIQVGVEHTREDAENTESLNSPVSPLADPSSVVTTNIRSSIEADTKEFGVSPYPKYASSPRPNNSYMFKREPPEGAESVKPFKEQETRQLGVFTSCPDVKKNNFNKSTISAFTPLVPKFMQTLSTAMSLEQSGNNILVQQRTSLPTSNINPNTNFNAISINMNVSSGDV